jgi:rhodanese-related sulfurtransferase
MFNLFGNKAKKAIKKGAPIIDLRAAGAFDQGRIPGSINIPLDRIPINIGRIKAMRKPIIICSNYTSDVDKAIRILKSEGITGVINGGNWEKLIS